MNFTFHLEDIDKAAAELLKAAKSNILCFYGAMGMGKTTLIKALMRQCKTVDTVSSPSYSMVQEYHDCHGAVLAYHFDFYRLTHESEALDIGFEDYINSRAWILIEWPQKIASLLPEEAQAIHIHFIDETTRSIEFNPS